MKKPARSSRSPQRKPSRNNQSRKFSREVGREFSRESRDSNEESERPVFTPKQAPVKREAVEKAFNGIWSDLFSTPVHLDSALSKQAKNMKSILARIVPIILLRPASQAEAMGIGVPAGEPWKLSPDKIKNWRPASVLAQRMYEGMIHRPVQADPVMDDYPPHMTEEWTQEWGNKTAQSLVKALANEAPLSLRVSRKFKVADVLKGLKEGSKLPVSAQASDLSPMGIRLGGYAPVLHNEWYEKGAFEIQDEGSQVMSYFALWPELYGSLLSKEPGPAQAPVKLPPLPKDTAAWTVIDACAGAGGKSLAMADALQGKGRVYSYDTSDKKLLALRRRAKHAGLNNIQTLALKEGQEAESLKRFRRTAQVVLVDAPCSGWGVLRRNPDIKWRQGEDVLKKMPEIQKRLLALYSDLVAPGGRLVFGTCTFRKSETLDVVQDFLKNHPDFKAKEGGYLGPDPSDGFFMQAFERVAK
jgi:16S rRNA C967 or C1407 C5-methylase (RsmB/RsmF family)